MRSTGGMNPGPPAVVTRRTKSTIPDFAAPSVQESSPGLASSGEMDECCRSTKIVMTAPLDSPCRPGSKHTSVPTCRARPRHIVGSSRAPRGIRRDSSQKSAQRVGCCSHRADNVPAWWRRPLSAYLLEPNGTKSDQSLREKVQAAMRIGHCAGGLSGPASNLSSGCAGIGLGSDLDEAPIPGSGVARRGGP